MRDAPSFTRAFVCTLLTPSLHALHRTSTPNCIPFFARQTPHTPTPIRLHPQLTHGLRRPTLLVYADRRLRHQHDLRHHPMFSGTMVFGVSPAGTTHESINCSAAWHRSRQGSRRPSWRGAEGRGGAGLLPAVSAASSRSFLPQYRSDLGTIWDDLGRSRGTFELCVSLTQG